jgi:hypothetical protein
LTLKAIFITIKIIVFGGFTKLRKVAISFVTPVYPPVRMEHLGPHWTNVHEILSMF